MPLRRLHLVVDDDLGPVLWALEEVSPGRSRPSTHLGGLIAQVPAPLDGALADAVRAVHAAPEGTDPPLRHRLRVLGSRGEFRRIPALPLDDAALVGVVGAIRALVAARVGDDVATGLAKPLADGSSIQLLDGLVLMPDTVAAVVQDMEAEQLVARRQIDVELRERFGQVRAHWRPLTTSHPHLLDALVDARAHAAFATHVAAHGAAGRPSAAHDPQAPSDPHGMVLALAGEAPMENMDIPALRRIQRALDDYITSGRARVHLHSTDSALVVRLHQPPPATTPSPEDDGPHPTAHLTPPAPARWLLQTCLREPDGPVHPVARLRSTGDLSAEGAAEAAGEVMRLAPTVRGAEVDETGLDWQLTTAEASAFLTHDTPVLEQAGVTVLLPRDWTKQKARLKVEAGEDEQAAPKPGRGTGVGVDAMASFRWRIAVGDTDLTEEEIADIRDAQQELVQLRGQWVRLDQDTMRAAERFLDEFGARSRRRPPGLPGALGRRAAGAMSGRPGTSADGSDGGDASADGSGTPGDGEPDQDPIEAEFEALANWHTLFRSVLYGKDISLLDIDWARGGPPFPARGGEEGYDPAQWRNTMTRLLPKGPGPVPYLAPTTLRATLRDYQLAGLNWMWALQESRSGGILADDMGLGKTMQVLALLCRERETMPGDEPPLPWDPVPDEDTPGLATRRRRRHHPGPTLLVCPMSVVGSWQREAARFAPDLAVHVHHGGDRIRDESFTEGVADMDLVITTYSLLVRDLELLTQVDWHRIVFDEAQHVKNPNTAVSRAAAKIPATYVFALTGTPVENRLGDLHAIMSVVNPQLLGQRKEFQEKIAGPIESEDTDRPQCASDAPSGPPQPGGRSASQIALNRLKLVIDPFVLRRVKTDRAIIDDLPEKYDETTIVSLTPEQAGLYEALVDELQIQLEEADQAHRRTVVMSTLTKLKQVCNHPAHYLGDGSPLLRDGVHRSGKLEYVDDLLEKAFDAGEKVLLFTQFTTFGHMLVPYWTEKFGRPFPFLHGGVAKKDRDAMVADFQSRPGEPGAMLLSLRAGGTGLTLTAANHVVHLDRWWNPAVENQATDRAFRIGQTKDVQVRKLVCQGTVEQRIDGVIRSKQGLADATITAAPPDLSTLEDEELWKLLSLDEGEDGGGADGEGGRADGKGPGGSDEKGPTEGSPRTGGES
jgi:hypothetical protein